MNSIFRVPGPSAVKEFATPGHPHPHTHPSHHHHHHHSALDAHHANSPSSVSSVAAQAAAVQTR